MCGMAQAMDIQVAEGTGKGAQKVSGCVSWHWFHEKCGGVGWCPQNCYHPFNIAWDCGRRYLPFFGEGFLATILLVRRNTPEPSAPLLSCRRSPGRSCVSCAGLLRGGSLLWDPRGGAVRLCDVDDGAANRRDHLGGDMQLMGVAGVAHN